MTDRAFSNSSSPALLSLLDDCNDDKRRFEPRRSVGSDSPPGFDATAFHTQLLFALFGSPPATDEEVTLPPCSSLPVADALLEEERLVEVTPVSTLYAALMDLERPLLEWLKQLELELPPISRVFPLGDLKDSAVAPFLDERLFTFSEKLDQFLRRCSPYPSFQTVESNGHSLDQTVESSYVVLRDSVQLYISHQLKKLVGVFLKKTAQLSKAKISLDEAILSFRERSEYSPAATLFAGQISILTDQEGLLKRHLDEASLDLLHLFAVSRCFRELQLILARFDWQYLKDVKEITDSNRKALRPLLYEAMVFLRDLAETGVKPLVEYLRVPIDCSNPSEFDETLAACAEGLDNLTCKSRIVDFRVLNNAQQLNQFLLDGHGADLVEVLREAACSAADDSSLSRPLRPIRGQAGHWRYELRELLASHIPAAIFERKIDSEHSASAEILLATQMREYVLAHDSAPINEEAYRCILGWTLDHRDDFGSLFELLLMHRSASKYLEWIFSYCIPTEHCMYWMKKVLRDAPYAIDEYVLNCLEQRAFVLPSSTEPLVSAELQILFTHRRNLNIR